MDDTKPKYAWPFDLDAIPKDVLFGTSAKSHPTELASRIVEARELMHCLSPSGFWRHYKGAVYSTTGYEIDANDGSVRVSYEEMGDVRIGNSATFTMPLRDWLTTFILEQSCPGNPNLCEDDAPYHVFRYVPVQKITRFETERQAQERGA